MCGIAGLLTPDLAAEAWRHQLSMMAGYLRHRGPDGEGAWWDVAAGIGLTHRRLAVIDLSTSGTQPMTSASGRYWISYNGEVYNHRELRDELAPDVSTWRGTSDTEVLLAAIERWGLAATLDRLDAMFAFALWDTTERRLHLVRDRFGEKPLYFASWGTTFAFASGLDALRTLPGFPTAVDREAVSLLIRHGHVPAPWSIFQHARKLEPGHGLTVELRHRQPVHRQWQYWQPSSLLVPARSRERIDPRDAAAAVEDALTTAVRRRLVADVPVGALLSGGIDSSLIVALMQRASSERVRTYTVGFDDTTHDEAPFARRVASHLGTDHRELRVTPADVLALIPSLPTVYDEPFADASQLPTTLITRLVSGEVRVCLTGDGGDELFGGYRRYVLGSALWAVASHLPARRWLASRLAGASTTTLAALTAALPTALWRATGLSGGPIDKLRRLGFVLAASDLFELYRRLTSQGWWTPPLVREESMIDHRLERPAGATTGLCTAERMMYLDLLNYLPDDILAKVDRAAMAWGLETRLPFLSLPVATLAWRLPPELKLRRGRGKRILRVLLRRHLPTRLIERPKQGFGVPLAAWLRGPLRAWAGDLLSPAAVASDDLLDATAVGARWQQLLAGDDTSAELWNALVLRQWLTHRPPVAAAVTP